MGKYMRMLVVWIGGMSICLAGCATVFYLPEDVASICLSDGKALAAAEDFCQSRQAALADLLDRQPLTVTVASYADEDVVPALSSPNMLQAILRNRSGETICNVLVAFVAWDEDNRPVKIKE